MASGQENSNNSKRRKLTSSDTNSILRRTFGNRNIDNSPILSKMGPIYPMEAESLVLNRRSLESQEGAYSANNPNGIIPVVVHPQLVLKQHEMELSNEQKEGIQFLWDRYVEGQGGILAHEMGLGKTRTAITIIATLLEQSHNSKGKSVAAINKAIVIAPLNAVSVWKDEFDKWCPNNICKVISLTSNQKDGWQTVENFRQPNSLHNVMVLSYETFKKYESKYDDGFLKYASGSVGLVICDEAHRLKNSETQLVKDLKKFTGAKLWFGITGTPYQNNLNELCNLAEFFCRDLEALDLKKKYCKPITETLGKFKKLSSDQKDLLKQLRSILQPCLHYRKNSFNIERHELLLSIALDGHPDYHQLDDIHQVQHTMYQLISESLTSTREITFFEKISYLTKACIHPEEAYKAIQKHPVIFERALDYYRENYPEYDEAEGNERYTALLFSTKIRVASIIVGYIRDERPDEKIVIVSESTVLLKKIENCVKAILDMKCLTYDGESSASQRENAVKLFENDDRYRILLLSEKAGGTALTLTRANHLLILEPDYNPANDWQALGRIYRYGQNRTAFIYRLMCTGTLEEVKFLRQIEKGAMGNTFQAEDDVVDFNVKAPYDEKELIQYYPETRSYLNDKLDEIQIAEFNADESDSSNFASELKKSKKYRESCEVPDELDIIRGNVWDSVSHCFHIHKQVDRFTQYLLNDESESVDGNVVPSSPL